MQNQLIKEVNEKAEIVELVQEFVQLTKKGKNYMGLCPFHDEKTPSFSVSPEKNIAVCMSCKKGGNPVFFYKSIKNLSVNEAVFELANKLGITNLKAVKNNHKHDYLYRIMQEAARFYSDQLKHSKIPLDYLNKRNVDLKIVNHFQLGYAPKNNGLFNYFKAKSQINTSDLINLSLIKQNETTGQFYDFFQDRLIFPISNSQGKIIAFSGRSLNQQETIKYLNSSETIVFKKSEILYQYFENQNEIRKKQTIVLHEGFFDVLASFKAGIKHVIATMGTKLDDKHISLLKKVSKNIIIAYDGDAPGKTAALEIGKKLQQNEFSVQMIYFPDNLDPDEYVKTNGITKYNELFINELKDFLELQIDLICQKLTFNNQTEIKNQLYDLFENENFGNKIIYQQYLQQKYQLPINLNKIVSQTPFKISSFQSPINHKKFNREIHMLIAFIKDRKFFKKNYKTLADTSVYSDIIISDFIRFIEKYYNDNPQENKMNWSSFKNINFNSSINKLFFAIEQNHWFNDPQLTQQEFDIYVSLLRKIKSQHQTKEEIQNLKFQRERILDKKEKEKLAEQIRQLQIRDKKIHLEITTEDQ